MKLEKHYFSSNYVINMLDAFSNNFDHISIIQIPKNLLFLYFKDPKIGKNGLKSFLTLNLKDAT